MLWGIKWGEPKIHQCWILITKLSISDLEQSVVYFYPLRDIRAFSIFYPSLAVDGIFFFLAGNSTISEINGKALAFSALLSMCFSTTLGVGRSVKHYLKGSGKNEKRAYHLMIQLKKSVEGSRTRMTWKKNVESWGLLKQMEWEVWWEAMG